MWISAAVEYGAPTETAVSLMRWGGLSRPGALKLSDDLGPVWAGAADMLRQDDSFDPQLTPYDQSRLRTMRARLQRDPEDASNP
jgi:hypothetical protein